MIPRGLRPPTSSIGTWGGNSSLNTPQSRTRRAISCEDLPPQSSTPTSSAATGATAALLRCSASGAATSVIYEGGYLPVRRAHADALVALQRLALRLQRRRDDDLCAVELREVLVPAGGHRGAQAAEQ